MFYRLLKVTFLHLQYLYKRKHYFLYDGGKYPERTKVTPIDGSYYRNKYQCSSFNSIRKDSFTVNFSKNTFKSKAY